MLTANRLCVMGLSLVVSTTTYATNPMPGWYGGLILGVSAAPPTSVAITVPTIIQNLASHLTPPKDLGATISSQLSYSIFGDVGGQVGFRYDKFRVEGELLYNNNPYDTLTIGDQKVQGVSSSAGLRLQGGTNSGFLMLNGYYDFYTPSEDNLSPLIPYVGLGLGYAYVENNIQFYYDNTQLTVGNIVEKYTKPAGQVIIGASYFLDDLTSFGLDFRYLTTASNTKTTEYNVFKTNEQIYTLNLTFNGAFDLG